MSPENLLVPAVLGGLCILYALMLKRAREQALVLPDEHGTGPVWWPLGDGLWRGAIRSILVVTPMVIVFIALGYGFNRVDPSSPLYDLLGAAGFLVVTAMIALSANRPRWAVPRQMRSHRGILAQRRVRRAGARRAPSERDPRPGP